MLMTNGSRGSGHLGDMVGKEEWHWRSAHRSVAPGPRRTLFLGARGPEEAEGGDPGVRLCVGAELQAKAGCPALSVAPAFRAGGLGSCLHSHAPSVRPGPSCLLNRQKQRGKKEYGEGGNEVSGAPLCSRHPGSRAMYTHMSSQCHPVLRGGQRRALREAGARLAGLSGRAGCPARGEIQKGQGLPTIPSTWWQSPVWATVLRSN